MQALNHRYEFPLSARLIDSHCHLDFDAFDKDRELVVARAWEARLIGILNPGVDMASSRQVVGLSQQHSGVYAAVGVHPNSASTWKEDTLDELRRLAGQPEVVAIGEIGLDYYRDRAPRPFQQSIFRHQLDLAAELGLPVIIHSREAQEDVLTILSDWVRQLKQDSSPLVGRAGVLHAYSGSSELALQAIELGFYLGIGGAITFPNALRLCQVVVDLPLERLLVETDAPFLAPQQYRGQRNEPAYVFLVAEKLAELRRQSFETIAEMTTAAAEHLFGWSEVH